MAGNEWNTVSHKHKRDTCSGNDNAGDVVVYSPFKKKQTTEHRAVKKFVLILVGIPGSGKSHVACKLEKLAPQRYERVSQDILGNRRECENLTRSILRQNKIPIIDRCNFNPEQRQHWIDIASAAGVPVDCIVFSYNKEECIRRCQQRKNHETITAKNASLVVRKMAGMFQPPTPGSNRDIFRQIQRVSSFAMADEIVQKYLHI